MKISINNYSDEEIDCDTLVVILEEKWKSIHMHLLSFSYFSVEKRIPETNLESWWLRFRGYTHPVEGTLYIITMEI